MGWRQRIDASQLELEEKVVSIKQCNRKLLRIVAVI